MPSFRRFLLVALAGCLVGCPEDNSAADDGSAADDACNASALNASSFEALNRAQSNAQRSCSNDDDCSKVVLEVPCIPTCGGAAAVARDGRAAFEAALERIDDEHCSAYDECGVGYPIASCATPRETIAACVTGKCQIVETDHDR